MSKMDVYGFEGKGRIFGKCLNIGAAMKDYHIADCICQKSVVPQQFNLFHRALKC
jgi:hypothetical protein